MREARRSQRQVERAGQGLQRRWGQGLVRGAWESGLGLPGLWLHQELGGGRGTGQGAQGSLDHVEAVGFHLPRWWGQGSF